jgi:hypothetical protein
VLQTVQECLNSSKGHTVAAIVRFPTVVRPRTTICLSHTQHAAAQREQQAEQGHKQGGGPAQRPTHSRMQQMQRCIETCDKLWLSLKPRNASCCPASRPAHLLGLIQKAPPAAAAVGQHACLPARQPSMLLYAVCCSRCWQKARLQDDIPGCLPHMHGTWGTSPALFLQTQTWQLPLQHHSPSAHPRPQLRSHMHGELALRPSSGRYADSVQGTQTEHGAYGVGDPPPSC